MIKQGKRIGRAAIAAGVVVAVGVAGAASAGAGSQSSYHGVFTETATPAGLLYDIHGSAKMTIGPEGTVVKINVSGLPPLVDSLKPYGSHLHNGACALASPGGGHYQDDVGPKDPPVAVTPPNELWLTTGTEYWHGLVPNSGGVAHATGSATWQARVDSAATNAKSVVVHAPGGAKIACADLQ